MFDWQVWFKSTSFLGLFILSFEHWSKLVQVMTALKTDFFWWVHLVWLQYKDNKISSKSINLFSRYWMETKFWHQSRAITQLEINEKSFVMVLTYILSLSMHLQNFIKIHQLIHKILSVNEISTSIEGHNSVENEQKILFNHPNRHHINTKA